MGTTTQQVADPTDYRAIARAMALKYGVNPDIFESQIEAESNFDPTAESAAGAQGIAQIIGDPLGTGGIDTSDPVASLDYAAQLMASYLSSYGGDYRQALGAYNAGPGAVESGAYLSYPETTGYIEKILGQQYDSPTSSDPSDPRNDPTNRNPRIGTNGAGGGTGGPAVGMSAADLRAAQIREIQARTDLTNAQKQQLLDQLGGAPNSPSSIANANDASRERIAGNQLTFDQANQKWKEAIDARDFQAAEFWKARSAELGQNNLALDYTKMMAGLKGPQDWVTYWKMSHGESPVPGQQGIALQDSLPSWARGTNPGTYNAPGASNTGGIPNPTNTGAAPPSAPSVSGTGGGPMPPQLTGFPQGTKLPAWADKGLEFKDGYYRAPGAADAPAPVHPGTMSIPGYGPDATQGVTADQMGGAKAGPNGPVPVDPDAARRYANSVATASSLPKWATSQPAAA